MALYDVPDGEHLLAKAALDRALAERGADDPAELVVHLGPSTLRRAVWALPTIDAALARFDRADVAWSAGPIVRALLAGHLAARRGGVRTLLTGARGRTPSPRGGPRGERW
ncbi:MAG TPA: hypothetical protein VFS00_14040, partial [Polyangiaceae bacterium]|nr:hypothetical protein [Polyangiaceae bacterium]